MRKGEAGEDVLGEGWGPLAIHLRTCKVLLNIIEKIYKIIILKGYSREKEKTKNITATH